MLSHHSADLLNATKILPIRLPTLSISPAISDNSEKEESIFFLELELRSQFLFDLSADI